MTDTRARAIKRWDVYICDCAIGRHIEHVEDATGSYVSYDDHISALADERRLALEEAAKVLTDEVAKHRAEYGEHQYCDDYGCHYLLTLADKIKAQQVQP